MVRWGYSYPWGSCLERGTAAENAGLPPINVYECVFVKSVVGHLVSCGGHTERPPTWRGDATDAFHGYMPCARLRSGPRSALIILARSRETDRFEPIYFWAPSFVSNLDKEPEVLIILPITVSVISSIQVYCLLWLLGKKKTQGFGKNSYEFVSTIIFFLFFLSQNWALLDISIVHVFMYERWDSIIR